MIRVAADMDPSFITELYDALMDEAIDPTKLSSPALRNFFFRFLVHQKAKEQGPKNGTRLDTVTMPMKGVAAVLGAGSASVKRPQKTYRSLAGVHKKGEFEAELSGLSKAIGAEALRAFQQVLDASHHLAKNYSKFPGERENHQSALDKNVALLRDALCASLGPLAAHQQRIDTLEARVLHQAQTIQAKTNESNSHYANFVEKSKTIEDKNGTIQDQKLTIQTRDKSICAHFKEIRRLEDECEEKDKEIQRLEDEGKEKDEAIERLERDDEDFQRKKKELFERLAFKRKELEKLQGELNEAQDLVEKQREEIKQLKHLRLQKKVQEQEEMLAKVSTKKDTAVQEADTAKGIYQDNLKSKDEEIAQLKKALVDSARASDSSDEDEDSDNGSSQPDGPRRNKVRLVRHKQELLQNPEALWKYAQDLQAQVKKLEGKLQGKRKASKTSNQSPAKKSKADIVPASDLKTKRK